MSLLEQVDHLRGLAQADQGTTLVMMALLNVLEEMAARLDRLIDDNGQPRGFGSI